MNVLIPTWSDDHNSWVVLKLRKGSCTARVIETGLSSLEEADLMIELLEEEIKLEQKSE